MANVYSFGIPALLSLYIHDAVCHCWLETKQEKLECVMTPASLYTVLFSSSYSIKGMNKR